MTDRLKKEDFVRLLAAGGTFSPVEFAVGKLPTDYLELRAWVRDLQVHSKERQHSGYTLLSHSYAVKQLNSILFL